jgi:hypothetical protein
MCSMLFTSMLLRMYQLTNLLRLTLDMPLGETCDCALAPFIEPVQTASTYLSLCVQISFHWSRALERSLAVFEQSMS